MALKQQQQQQQQSSCYDNSIKSVVPLALPIAGPEDGNTGYPTAEVDTKNENTTKTKKDKKRSKRKRRADGKKTDGRKYDGKNDVEANEAKHKNKTFDEYTKNNEPEDEVRTFKCFHMRLGYADLCKLIVLWAVIATMALSDQVMEKIFPGTKTPLVDNEITTCSLCPVGQSVTDPLQEIIRTDFQCTTTDSTFESVCLFECEDSLPTSRVYTCGEVEKLAKEATNNCSDSADSCREFQQTDTQCCHETF